MQRPQANENKTSAIIRFFIGLCVLMILLFFIYYVVAVRDWSYLAGDNSRQTASVSATAASPFDTPVPAVTATPVVPVVGAPVETDAPYPGDVGSTPAPVSPTSTPTAKPTPTPAPTPTPTPTPDPTKIPASEVSAFRSKKFNMPEPGENGEIGISRCYVSKPDQYKIIVLEGWGYIDQDDYNGTNSATYLVTTSESTGQQRLYQATNIAGLSGRAHNSKSMNPAAADWRVTIDVSDYADGIYKLTLGLGYKPSGISKTTYVVYPFDDAYSFTVLGGEVIVEVPVSTGN